LTVLADLHQACAAHGTRLFTVTALDEDAGVHRRVYTSHPVDYPLQGTKPLDRDAWYQACIAARQPFVANRPEAFAQHFFDHALIVSLGLGSCVNLPVLDGTKVLGTVNLLAEAGHFTPDRLAGYAALVAQATPALGAALRE
jgi:GAF domain